MTAESAVDFRAQLRVWCAEADAERAVQEEARRAARAAELEARSMAGLVEAEASFIRWERRAGRLPGANAPTLPGL